MTDNNIKKSKANELKNQRPYAYMILFFCLVAGLYFFTISKLFAFYWISGIGFGFILQKSRFCFTSAFRDLHMTGSTLTARAVLIAVGITTLGFFIIKFQAFSVGNPIPGQSYINPIGLSTIAGGIIFGTGMVIAGGCASGVLMRVGDGFQMQAVALIFFILGSFLGANHSTWWQDNFSIRKEGIFIPDLVGWPLALFIQISLIALLYFLSLKWESKNLDS
ncbi:YeeE/YedE thiosulfate transporter family protein [Alkalibacter mobilis]|uniref:YeeE/YedE thiosulfate transporter family protein n=1 Tax=Alkalibacter mobilis TaxID=2787712 RepID=UPI0018A0DE7C|nr:YeeE/YedE thiosulfate transporter family protein [Alkalibacter mobilis]MBF7096236.1 YeeE/YedE family protein [Alkalibacter mobilis]